MISARRIWRPGRNLTSGKRSWSGLKPRSLNSGIPTGSIVLSGSNCCTVPPKNRKVCLSHKKVIGLQNLDSESEEYRAFKEMIERLNRTYRFHIRAACGFGSDAGAMALTTLFVTDYNFLRPHTSLGYRVPVPLKELEGIPKLQDKWSKVIRLACNSIPA